MPTYEYSCKQCGEHLEVVQSFKDEPLEVCPNCGGELKKVFGSIGIVFKGSGFYKTDSRSGASAGKKAEAPAAAGSSTAKESSGDSKPAASTPAQSSPAASGSSSGSGSGSGSSGGSSGGSSKAAAS